MDVCSKSVASRIKTIILNKSVDMEVAILKNYSSSCSLKIKNDVLKRLNEIENSHEGRVVRTFTNCLFFFSTVFFVKVRK